MSWLELLAYVVGPVIGLALGLAVIFVICTACSMIAGFATSFGRRDRH